MAQTTELGRVLQLQFNVGTTSKGEIKVKNHNFPHVNPNVADDDLLAVGNALADLFSMPLYQVARTDQVALSVDSSSTVSTSSSSSTNSSGQAAQSNAASGA